MVGGMVAATVPPFLLVHFCSCPNCGCSSRTPLSSCPACCSACCPASERGENGRSNGCRSKRGLKSSRASLGDLFAAERIPPPAARADHARHKLKRDHWPTHRRDSGTTQRQ